jgi:predicted nuclease of predicted toxin-antitoxin system
MHAGEIGMGKSADDAILAWSLGKNAIMVTLDADFHSILAVSGASGPSVTRLRIQGLGA